MKYDLLIYDSESLVNAFDGRHNVIRLNGISIAEAEGLTAILLGYDVSVCLSASLRGGLTHGNR